MLSLRVSDLDQWVRYCEPEIPEFEVSLDDFLAYMRRKAPQTIDMQAGQAFHSLLEHANVGDAFSDGLTATESEGFRFHFDIEAELALPAFREKTIQQVYKTSVGPVLLRGKIDGQDLLEAIDYKLTTSPFDAERYASSLQWRAYLDMTELKRFRYLVFQAKREEVFVRIFDLHEFKLWAYPGMSQEVRQRVDELARFVSVHVPELMSKPLPAGAR